MTRLAPRAVLLPLWPRAWLLITALWLLNAIGVLAVSEPNAPPEAAAARRSQEKEVAECTALLVQHPESVRLYSRRGDAHLFLAHFAEAVADFEKMIALDPAQDAPHWRLGIAYYLQGAFPKSARQFEKYHSYDGGDRENGIWQFLARAQFEGVEKARAKMLVYTQFDREPFPALYQVFAGARTTPELLAELAGKHLENDSRVMFFARYYAGLNEALLGRAEAGLKLIDQAVTGPWGRTDEGGPAYMWQVARLQADQLRQRLARPPALNKPDSSCGGSLH